MTALFRVEANMTDEELEVQVQLAVKALRRAGLPFTEERIRGDIVKRRTELQAFNRKEDERINERVKEQYPQLAPLMRPKRTEEPTTREVVETMRDLVGASRPVSQPNIYTPPALSTFAASTLKAFLQAFAALANSQHHLKYTHTEDDGEITFVCICEAGFSVRENWNAHIQQSFSEVIG